jgi:hypothetical protein
MSANFSHHSKDTVDQTLTRSYDKKALPEGFHFLPEWLDEAAQIALTMEVGHLLQPVPLFEHARIKTTAIFASAIGDEERNLARRAWSSLEPAIPDRTDLTV